MCTMQLAKPVCDAHASTSTQTCPELSSTELRGATHHCHETVQRNCSNNGAANYRMTGPPVAAGCAAGVVGGTTDAMIAATPSNNPTTSHHGNTVVVQYCTLAQCYITSRQYSCTVLHTDTMPFSSSPLT